MQQTTSKTVAIVDDDQFLLESLHDFFDAMGIESWTYNSADEFLKSGDIPRVHCVLADVKMPGTSGLELLEQLVKQNGPPVCLMTSFADDRTKRAAERGGAIGFLEKPISPAALLALISSSGGQ
ncbi:response regulator [Neorhizobium sp. CSC1952]|uniref:response regulator transcription factor n=1 Tax=Neorhizobium sp. CSC1952 TaxID=2978974 RepID=UPI0025A58B5D|nr:response regulator [Rhizobium sp. CSC1952]WJR66357.1 response regulator [Rhizobium sp. CSC1952]